jgi:GNAT superfamily N-acetyltransferase
VPTDKTGTLLQFAIREADSSEAGTLSSLAFRSKAYWGYDIDFMKRCRGELTYSAGQISSAAYRFYVCENGDRPIAFYALQLLADGVAEMEALFVEKKFIGQGIGTALVEHARDLANQLGIHTIVIQGDPNAEEFYLSVGAVAAGYRESASIPGRFLPVFNLRVNEEA